VQRRSDAPALLLAAAKRLEPVDAQLARETHAEALEAALTAGRTNGRAMVRAAAEAARRAPPPPGAPRPLDLLLDGMASLVLDGYTAGAPLLKRALEQFRGESAFRTEQHLRWLGLAGQAALALWDDETAHALATRQVQLARHAGALAVLPSALTRLAILMVQAGELASAAALLDEADAVARVVRDARVGHGALVLAAWRDEARTHELVAAVMHEAAARGDSTAATAADYAIAVLENGTGRRSAALAAARRAVEHDRPGLSAWVLPELVEAAVRSGKPQLARAALEQLCEATRASGTDLALGIEARSRALLSDGDAADRLYRQSISRLGRCRAGAQLARAHLLYGEWLGRNGRRSDARAQLRTARDLFATMGAEVFMRWAAYELQAAGENPRARAVVRDSELTAQEARIAGLAGDGLTNREIGLQLSISPRTVEYHLHKVFTKLGLRSRNQLRIALPEGAGASLPERPADLLAAAASR
jgi:DNA-binding CsgD family transcriptional regulator